MVMKNKQLSSKTKKFITAGSGKMIQGQATGPQKPGVSSQEHSRTKSKTCAKGGTTKMFGFTGSKPQTPA